MEEEIKTNYEAYIFCNNCHHHDKISINKGIIINEVKCPNCDNLTLEIDPNGAIFDRKNNRSRNFGL